MSAATQRAPRSVIHQSPKPGTTLDEDGGLYVTPEQLAIFGDGDGKRGRQELRSFLAVDWDGPVYNGPTKMPASVRLGGPADEAALVDLFTQEVAEVASFMGPVDPDKILEVIQVGTRLRGGFVGMIDGPEKKPVAATVLHPCQWWFSQGWYYFEICLYVHPDYRRTKHASDLLDFQRWVVDEQSRGMGYRVYLVNGILGARRTHSKIRLYRRKFAQAGAAFVYPSPFTAERSK